ncbi:MAG: DUF4159 domain-containing protein [Planctomycetota bacterium]
MAFPEKLLCICASLAAACAWAAAGEGQPQSVTPEQVETALRRGALAARRDLVRFEYAQIGYATLCVMALLNAGVPRDEPDVNAAINRIVQDADRLVPQYEAAYQLGLACMLLHMLKDANYRRPAERLALALEQRQNPDGGWGWGSSDNSRTQFALLGLKAAQDLGVKVPPEVFKRARRYVLAGQNKLDGSWSYRIPADAGYGSMTAAGITSLFIINEQAYKESAVCGGVPEDWRLQKALAWLGENFAVNTNPRHGSFHYYYLYAMERIGVLTGQKFIGGHDWYREGAEYLVRRQLEDGSWSDASGILATEFALLFLGKGREPVAVQKLCYEGEWNSDPYDAKDLVEQASRDLKLPMTCQVVDTGASAGALLAAPILYIQGHKSFALPHAAREAIKVFVEQGGFLFASACCGSSEFDRSFRAEMALLFPDAAFEPLPANHEIYSGPHRIANPQACGIEGLNTGCRTAVLYAPHDVCCAWGGCKGCADKNAITGQEAKDLGVNMIAYALDFQKMREKLDASFVVAGKAGDVPQRNTVIIGQLFHGGDWNPDPGSIPNLGKTLKEQTGCTAEFGKRRVVLGSDDPGDYPLLYLTGHKDFQFTPAQVDALRAYLDRGGFLLSDPCCGRQEFDTAFRKLCQQLYPDRPLAPLPPGHPALRTPYQIDTVEYKPAVKKLFPAVGNSVRVEGLSAPDGRLLVFYSRFNLGCELQGHGCANCLGLAKGDAYRLAVNAVMYALAH